MRELAVSADQVSTITTYGPSPEEWQPVPVKDRSEAINYLMRRSTWALFAACVGWIAGACAVLLREGLIAALSA